MLPISNPYILKILLPLFPKTRRPAILEYLRQVFSGNLLLWLFLLFAHFPSYSQNLPAFKAGEYLKYSIYYGPIRGGEAVMEVKRGIYKGSPVNHLHLNGKTVGVANALYNVNDIYQSFTNVQTDLPYEAIRDINEGRYTKYTVQTFDHWSRADSSIVQSTSTGEVVVPKNSHDILSAFYYIRNHLLSNPLTVGDTLLVETYFDDEQYTLRVRFMGYETIKTKVGKVECMKLIPIVITGRVFKNPDDMIVWFSKDKNFLPIRIRFNLFVGAVFCDLIEYKGLLHAFEPSKK